MSRVLSIELSGIGLEFAGRHVLRDFSASVGAGARVIISGPSGSGKSSLLHCILGFVHPSAGEVRIHGDVLDGQSVWRLRRRMCYVAQEPELGQGLVRDAVLAPLAFAANAQLADAAGRVESLFDAFGLGVDTLNKDLSDISGGEKQRVALASALLLDRDILLLDEVTSALDKALAEQVATHIRGLSGTTVVAVCHRPADLDLGGSVLSLEGRAQ